MRQQKRISLGEYTYELSQLSASEGLTVMSQLLPRLAHLAGAAQDPGKAIAAALEGLDLSAFARQFVPGTVVLRADKRVPLADVYEEHFAGDYDALVEWLVASVEHNFGPFLRKRLAAGMSLVGKTQRPSGSNSPTT